MKFYVVPPGLDAYLFKGPQVGIDIVADVCEVGNRECIYSEDELVKQEGTWWTFRLPTDSGYQFVIYDDAFGTEKVMIRETSTTP